MTTDLQGSSRRAKLIAADFIKATEPPKGLSLMKPSIMRNAVVLGWIAVGLSTAMSSLWAFWGVYESFHEGWYFTSFTQNLVLTAKYFALMLALVVVSVLAIRWPRFGGALYQISGAGFCFWILATRQVMSPRVILGWLPALAPLLCLGILFWKGRPKPARLAYQISVLLPVAIAIGFAIEPVARIASRRDDGNRGSRIVQGKGVELVWAPEGPGWPNPDPHNRVWMTQWRGPTWEEAQRVCRYLTADGTALANTPQDIWRLPTVEEVVRSMTRHGSNCGGLWNPTNAQASYATKPDKESPLWNPYSPIIYWWTSSQPNRTLAYSIDFNGRIYIRNTESNLGSQGFRAVRR